MKARLTLLFSAAALSHATAVLPPVITSANNTTFTVGVPGSFTFVATNPPLTNWQVATGTLPASISLDPATGKLTGTPVLADIGAYPVSVTVQNGGGANTSVPKAFTLTIRPVPRIVILKEASPYSEKDYGYTHNKVVVDEIAADTNPYAGTFSGTDTAYYVLDMVAQEFTRVTYMTTPGSGGAPAQKHYSVAPTAPFTSGFIDAMLKSRTANTLDVVYGKASQDLGGLPDSAYENLTSYRGLASPLAVTAATATVPAWIIPFAVKNLSGKIFDYGRDVLPTADPDMDFHLFWFATTTFTANIDSVLTPQANTGGPLPVIDPVTGLAVNPPQTYPEVKNSMAYGIRLVKNTLEKLKYSESP